MAGKKKNPFEVAFTTLYLPPGMGSSISVAGFSLEADDGEIEVPNHLVSELLAHGLLRQKPEAAVPAA